MTDQTPTQNPITEKELSIFDFGFEKNLYKTGQVEVKNPLLYDAIKDNVDSILIDWGNSAITSNSKLSYTLSSNQDITAGNVLIIPFNTKRYDISSEFSTTTSKFIPQRSGYYLIDASIEWKLLTATSGTPFLIQIMKNGNIFSGTYNAPNGATTGDFSIIVSDILYLLPTDYIQIRAVNGDGVNTQRIIGSSTYTYLSIHRIS